MLRQVIHVPTDCALYDTEDMCFTGPMQVQWVGQLLQETAAQFVLHADGKHKLEARAVQSGLISREGAADTLGFSSGGTCERS